ncbi:hypothetical protein GQ600_20382 [Phytophthora cactorum]|nr:hypothetical protein GQ600_20382 [Phytophthora cactorum]
MVLATMIVRVLPELLAVEGFSLDEARLALDADASFGMSWPEGGKRLPLWDAIYSGDIVAAQTLLVTKTGAAQVNAPHGVR